MRTTIDIPEDLHSQVSSISRDTRRSLSQTAVWLMRRGLGQDRAGRVYTDPATGRLLLDVPRAITPADVRSLEDEA
ncbi:MAG: hypothetical protein LBG60_06710 [Bifidobacteriaceae bacterium]|jgi:hypothetical protein|nr:hypothetical protein [Bifidobacteriaceae bacterium]